MAMRIFGYCMWWCCVVPLTALADDTVIAVIVSAQQATTQQSASQSLNANNLPSIFWRKMLYTEQGKPWYPVNLASEHPLRQRFSQIVLHSTPRSQVGYWNGLYFQGIQPPYSVQSEEAMIRMVADTENAVGYIGACKLDSRVKPVLWLSPGGMTTEPPVLHCEGK